MQIPSATYRIQLNNHFTLRDLRGIIDYLYELGISTIYASPITKAFKGSQHGYDTADPSMLNPEIGEEQELRQIAGLLKERGMNWLQDIVPNHMVYSNENPWLNDVLERGKQSGYYHFFDIDDQTAWEGGDKLMAPFLGNTLERCLREGQLTLQYTERGFVIRYFESDYPVAADLYSWIAGDTADPSAESCAADPSLIAGRIAMFNSRPDLMQTLLENQHYLLTDSRLAASHINYRRFFTVNSLICLRMEEEAVFAAYHQAIHRWYSLGWIQGLRIDHIDGLADPKKYLTRVRELFGNDCYLVAEKILAPDEVLPADWPLQGTTGYEFLHLAGQLLTDPDGSSLLLDYYRRRVIDLPGYADVVFERKHDFLCRYMGGELDNLQNLLTGSILQTLVRSSAPDKPRLKAALATWMASFPVYRIYADESPLSGPARLAITTASEQARHRRPDLLPELNIIEATCIADRRFLCRLMQFTGALAAKGVEDTTFYVYNPFISHNEVGDTPAMAGMSISGFHEKMRQRLSDFPYSINATTTHDTKRGEDSRIRLNLLSRKPGEWIDAVTAWRQTNRPLITQIKGRQAPSSNDEYLIYQALLGGFPEDLNVMDEFRERFSAYLIKALREAKTETSYDDPDKDYEQQCRSFAMALLQPRSAFLESFIPFAGQVIHESAAFSLSQLLIKLTAPGIPDIYQGAELWETSFVDPDNRRPVDYGHRIGLLRDIRTREATGVAAALRFVLNHPEREAIKMWVTYRVLNYRRLHPALFFSGEYIPVEIEGPVLGYIRRQEDRWVLVLVPLISSVEARTEGVRIALPKGAPVSWKELFTGEGHGVLERVLEWRGWDRFPVAMLIGV